MKTQKGINLIFKNTHADFKTVLNGEKLILISDGSRGSCLSAVEDLDDKSYQAMLKRFS
tara:strand:+ start:902 stop:1078 length:177 start_codon:yes stop_codon:yes gene_type:complete